MAGSTGIRQRVRWCAELLALRHHSLRPRESAQRRDGKAFVAAKEKKPGLSGMPKAALVFHSNPMRPLWYCAMGSARPDGNFPLCCQTGGGGSKLHVLNYSLLQDPIAFCMLLLMASKTAAATVTTVAQQRTANRARKKRGGKSMLTPATERRTGEAVGPRTAYPSPRRCVDVTSQNPPQAD